MSFFHPIVISKKIQHNNSASKAKSFAASFGVHASILAAVSHFATLHPIPLPKSEERIVISLSEFTSAEGDIHRIETARTVPETTIKPIRPMQNPPKPMEHKPSKVTPTATMPEEIPSSTPSVSPEASAPLALPDAAHTEPPKTTNDSPHLTPPSLTEQPNNVLERDNDIGGAALGHIRAMIEKAITYPSIARKLRLEGTVLVSFILKSDGTVDTAKVVSTSGSRVLDTRAIDTILSLSGDYPSLGKTVELSIPIAFNLKKV